MPVATSGSKLLAIDISVSGGTNPGTALYLLPAKQLIRLAGCQLHGGR